MEEKILEGDVLTLYDEDDQEVEMEVVATCVYEGTTYYALIPYSEEEDILEEIEYSILKESDEHLTTLDTEEEFNTVAALFDSMLIDEPSDEE